MHAAPIGAASSSARPPGLAPESFDGQPTTGQRVPAPMGPPALRDLGWYDPAVGTTAVIVTVFLLNVFSRFFVRPASPVMPDVRPAHT